LVNSTKLTVVEGMAVAPATMSEVRVEVDTGQEGHLGKEAGRVWNFCGGLVVTKKGRISLNMP
jgi:hypothetical protein